MAVYRHILVLPPPPKPLPPKSEKPRAEKLPPYLGGANPAVNTPRPSRGTRIESCDFIVLIGDP